MAKHFVITIEEETSLARDLVSIAERALDGIYVIKPCAQRVLDTT
jgi:hypothetical protein